MAAEGGEAAAAVVSRNEFRWAATVDDPFRSDLLTELMTKADSAGARALLERQIAQGVRPRALWGGFVSLARSAPGSAAYDGWSSLHDFIEGVNLLLDAPGVATATTLRRTLEQMRALSGMAIDHADLEQWTVGHSQALGGHAGVLRDTAEKLRAVDEGSVRSFLAGPLGPLLSAAAMTLSSILGWLAFAGGSDDRVEEELVGARTRVDAALAELSIKFATELGRAKSAAEALELQSKEAAEILRTVENAAGASLAAEFQGSFEATARDHDSRSNVWVAVATVVALCAVVLLSYYVELAFGIGTATTWQMLLGSSAPRALLVSVFLSAAFWCARMSALHRRAQIADRHRVNALKSYERLMRAAGPNEQSRAAVLAAVTSTLFGHVAVDDAPSPTLPLVSETADAMKRGK